MEKRRERGRCLRETGDEILVVEAIWVETVLIEETLDSYHHQM